MNDVLKYEKKIFKLRKQLLFYKILFRYLKHSCNCNIKIRPLQYKAKEEVNEVLRNRKLCEVQDERMEYEEQLLPMFNN